MFFFGLFVLYLEFNLSSSDLFSKTVINQFKFVKEINRFYVQTNLKESTTKNIKFIIPNSIANYKSGSILQDAIIETFENDILLLLQQLNNYYYNLLLDLLLIKNDYKNNEKNKMNYKVSLQSIYADEVCKFIRPSLDFIYLIKGKRPNLLNLYKLHSNLCNILPQVVHKCAQDDKSLCNVDAVNSLFVTNTVSDEIKNIYMKNDYQKTGKKFIVNMYSIIQNIDKVSLIKKNPPTYDDVLGNVPSVYRAHVITSEHRTTDTARDEQSERLDHGINGVNRDYFRKMTNECDPSTGLSKRELFTRTARSVTGQLLLYTLVRLEKHFKFNVMGDDSDVADTAALTAETNDRLCKHVPLILYHVNRDEAVDAKLFGLYFTFCGEYGGLIDAQCPAANGKRPYHDRRCAVKAMRDKFQIGFLSITGTVSKTDRYVNEAKCTRENYDYVKEVHDVLHKHYERASVPPWTAHEWWRVKYFLMDGSGRRSHGVRELQKHTVLVDAVPFALQDVFSKLLPWNSDKNTVLTFHSVLFHGVKATLNSYVYRLARTVILYFEKHAERAAEHDAFERLNGAVSWYKYATGIIDTCLCPQACSVADNGVSAITFTVKTMRTIDGVDKIRKAIPDSMQSELQEWSDNETRDADKDDDDGGDRTPVTAFNKMAKRNCKNAIDFVDDLISTSVKSNLIRKENQIDVSKLYKLYCGFVFL